MNKRDTIRVLQYDEEIAELEYLLSRELDREATGDSHLFLASRAFQYKLERLRSIRARYIRMCGNAANKQQRYSMIAAQKRAAIANAELEYKDMLVKYTLATNNVLIRKDANVDEDLRIIRSLLAQKKRQITACSNALQRWLSISPASVPAAMPTRDDEDLILDSKYMPKAELQLKQQLQQPLAPAPALSADQEIIARAARAQLERSQYGITNTSSARASVDISAQQPVTYSASFALLNHQPVAEEEEN